MADCAINFGLGFGADEPATAGSIMLRRVTEGRKGARLILPDFKQYDFTESEPLILSLEQGQVMESVEVRPRGRTRLWQVPAQDTINYAELQWLNLSPGTGTYVLEPSLEVFDGATGEPDIEVGRYWIATNPVHPDYGYLMQKGS